MLTLVIYILPYLNLHTVLALGCKTHNCRKLCAFPPWITLILHFPLCICTCLKFRSPTLLHCTSQQAVLVYTNTRNKLCCLEPPLAMRLLLVMLCAAKLPFPMSAIGWISVKDLIRSGFLEVIGKLVIHFWALQVIQRKKKQFVGLIAQLSCAFRSTVVDTTCWDLAGKVKPPISTWKCRGYMWATGMWKHIDL